MVQEVCLAQRSHQQRDIGFACLVLNLEASFARLQKAKTCFHQIDVCIACILDCSELISRQPLKGSA